MTETQSISYPNRIFDASIHRVNVLSIHIGFVNKEYLYQDSFGNEFHGGLLFKHLHLKEIVWNVISKLYRPVTTIVIY